MLLSKKLLSAASVANAMFASQVTCTRFFILIQELLKISLKLEMESSPFYHLPFTDKEHDLTSTKKVVRRT